MTMRTIYLRELCGTEVLSRSNARKLYDNIDEETEIVDMSEVSFVSRSVADELCNVKDMYPSLRFVGMEEDVRTMLDIVQKGRRSKRDYTSKAKISVTVNCRTMDDLRKALLSFGL
jgi:hypothetical protein